MPSNSVHLRTSSALYSQLPGMVSQIYGILRAKLSSHTLGLDFPRIWQFISRGICQHDQLVQHICLLRGLTTLLHICD
jgi:hypothetical protein